MNVTHRRRDGAERAGDAGSQPAFLLDDGLQPGFFRSQREALAGREVEAVVELVRGSTGGFDFGVQPRLSQDAAVRQAGFFSQSGDAVEHLGLRVECRKIDDEDDGVFLHVEEEWDGPQRQGPWGEARLSLFSMTRVLGVGYVPHTEILTGSSRPKFRGF
jgi:hypothetical protein